MSTCIGLAKKEDEARLRKLLAKTAMPGVMRLCYGREPNFFNSLDILGQHNQIIVARNEENIVGFGIRSIKSLYINNEIQQIGYLSNLRLEKEYRGNIVLIKGFKYLHELHKENPCLFYLTTIMKDNDHAKNILVKGRGLLPTYQPWGKLNTYLITGPRVKLLPANIQIELATVSSMDEILTFLQREGKQKQFFPHYTQQDLNLDTGLLRGIQVENIIVARQNHHIVGTIALWNQNTFKQILVHSYHSLLKLFRPIYNLYSKISHKPYLPKPGVPLNFDYGAMVCIKDNDASIFSHLLSAAVTHITKHNKLFLALGLHEDDSLNEILRNFKYKLIQSNLYLVKFPGQPFDFFSLKHKVPYLELGAL